MVHNAERRKRVLVVADVGKPEELAPTRAKLHELEQDL